MTPEEKIGKKLGAFIAEAGVGALGAWWLTLAWPSLFDRHPGFWIMWAVVSIAEWIIAVCMKGELLTNG
jgi:hypothetical protein